MLAYYIFSSISRTQKVFVKTSAILIFFCAPLDLQASFEVAQMPVSTSTTLTYLIYTS